jgi:hypothetical protein
MGGSIRKFFSRSDDADVMIGKTEVRGLHLDLRHVARSAIFIGHGTGSLAFGLRGLAFQRVTRQTLAVVVSGVLFDVSMRVVTGNTAYLFVV